MKSILLTLVFAIACIGVQAQTSKAFPLKSDVAGKTSTQAKADTAVNTTAKSQTAVIPGYWATISVQVDLTRISGTTAGKLYYEGSLTGSGVYEKVDSLTLANVAAQSKVFNSTPGKFVYYRVRVVPTGTQSTSFRSLAVARKQ
jgi:hypothetical protein